ncbi:NADP-dependent oxidoreductase [Halococcus sp. IIIV-5B]|uniref:NADP-dependent oxidoreductase n=1 Tax=Halococcus sp. IIIV-5B TaxID=2321230 RepID=UPI000E7425EF|nr:NADP-dependent oxidoreductase [Halococcus sp. IIIV-5B]RJT07100.1 NADP-dependent oxidoreductase [Halococcus sp. IIIV-5B]
MKAVRIHEFGEPEVLQYEDVDEPDPASDEVRLRVRAAGVNPVDWMTRKGMVNERELPWTVGWDVAGVVDEIGSAVNELEVGDEVYGLVGFPSGGGTYAEAMVAPEAELMKKPTSLSFEEAAGMPMVALTAWQALQALELQTGERVLIHAAAGGVGHLAVQFAKQQGFHVIGTASGSNEEFLRELGVDEFVNYREERFEEVLEPVDGVVDGVGGETFDRSLEILDEGRIIDKLPSPPTSEQKELANQHGVQAIMTNVHWDREWFGEITELVENGAISLTLDTVIPLSQAQEAHRLSEEKHAQGKIILSPENEESGSN